jgi:hypothetical protein
MRDDAHNAIQFAGTEETKLVFSGPPQALTGFIPLVNTSQTKQKIRSFPASAKALYGPAQLPLREVPFYVRLGPGQQATVPASFAVDPRTPSGTYDFEIQVGEKAINVTAFVTEVVDLAIQPQSITIVAGSASSYKRQFIAENRGNTKLPTGERCEAPLFDSFDLTETMLIGLRKSDKKSAESMVKGFLQEWSELAAGTLVVTREPMILNPGDKVVGEAEFHLPPDLRPLRHYRSRVEIYNAVLAVDVYTTTTIHARRSSEAKAGDQKKPARGR